MEVSEFKKLFKTTNLKKIGNDRLMEVAYHEAGHVLINLLYGLPGTRTTIIPDSENNSAGSVKHSWQQSGDYDFTNYIFGYCLDNDIEEWDRQKEIDYLVITQMAGIIGGAFYSGIYDWKVAANDFNQILDIFMDYMIFDIPDLQPYWDKTFDMIQTNINQLEKIAGDLYKYKTLDAEYFETIVL